MYIHGDMTTAKFAVIENPRIHQFKGRWADYTERLSYAKVHEVTRDFIETISWMTEDHPYVVHFCQNGIEDVCDEIPDIETDGESLLFAYDVFLMTRTEKSYPNRHTNSCRFRTQQLTSHCKTCHRTCTLIRIGCHFTTSWKRRRYS